MMKFLKVEPRSDMMVTSILCTHYQPLEISEGKQGVGDRWVLSSLSNSCKLCRETTCCWPDIYFSEGNVNLKDDRNWNLEGINWLSKPVRELSLCPGTALAKTAKGWSPLHTWLTFFEALHSCQHSADVNLSEFRAKRGSAGQWWNKVLHCQLTEVIFLGLVVLAHKFHERITSFRSSGQ